MRASSRRPVDVRAALAALGLLATLPAAAAPLPTHCRAGEFAVLDATMSRTVPRAGGGIDVVKNGKLLSLCADGPQEPFGRLAYRYGRPGSVEFERIATPANRFGVASESTTPHTGEDSVSFDVGKAHFRVAIATGQGSGVSLVVREGGRAVADLFSGNDEGSDFELGPATMRFDKALSPIFVHRGSRGDD